MNKTAGIPLIIGLAVAAVLALLSMYTVRQDQQALVLRFGSAVATQNEYGTQEDDAGLKYKWPLIEQVRIYDRKNLELDLAPQRILASDQEALIVDAFLRYRITDVTRFYQTFQTRQRAEVQLTGILDSLLRDTLASVPSQEIISGQRAGLMRQILDRANVRAQQGEFGVEMIDVRIMRADLPDTVEQQVFTRMVADRNEETEQNLGQGRREALRIEAEGRRTVEVTLAEARRQSELIRAEGDATQNRVYADAYSLDPDFFAFYRSMEALRNGLGENTSYVLSPDSDFLSYLEDDQGGTRR